MRYSVLYKAIAVVLVCLFVANDVAWAQPSDYTASKSSTLAAHTALSDPEFKEKFAIGEFLMSIEGAKRYIDEQLTREKNIFEASWRSSRTVTIEDINDLAVRGRIKGEVDGLKSVVIVRIAGLLSSIVQPALVDLFGDIDASKEFNGLPVIYIDSTLNTPDRCLQKHEIDEILQWEYFRVNVLHIEDKKGMAKWIRKHISSPDENLKRTDYKNFSARQIAKLFHGYSYPLRELYATLKDATDFDRDYLRTMLELYGTDDTSPRLNIAAGEVANETSSAVKDDISSVLSMINITPEEAKGRLDVRRKQHEEYLRTQPLSTGESAFRIFDYTSDDKIKILEVLLPLLGKLEAMPKDSASLLNTANFTKIWAQSRLGLYDLAQTTIDIAANSNSDPSSAQAVIDKKRDKQNGLSMLAKAKVKAGDFDGAHRLITQSGINNREDGMLGLLAELGFIKDLVLSLDYEISDPYYMSKDRAYISKVLAHLGLCDAALRLIVDKTKPEDSISAKVEIGITLAELGEREKAETILRDLVECDDKGLYKQPESTLEIIRLQLAIGTDRGLILNTLTKAEDALFQKKLPDNFIDMARLAELYFKMDPDKSREILEKSRQRFIEYTHHSSASDRWQSDFVVLFDCALKLGFYHEAQVMLDQYTNTVRGLVKDNAKKYPLLSKSSRIKKRRDRRWDGKQLLWQKMIDSKNKNHKPTMSVTEEIWGDLAYWGDAGYIGTLDNHEKASTKTLLEAVEVELKEDRPGAPPDHLLQYITWRVLRFLEDSNPDEVRRLAKDTIRKIVTAKDFEGYRSAPDLVSFLLSDTGRALYGNDPEYWHVLTIVLKKEIERADVNSSLVPLLTGAAGLIMAQSPTGIDEADLLLFERFLKTNVRLDSINFRDGGNAVTNNADFMKGILCGSVPFAAKNPPDGMPILYKAKESMVTARYKLDILDGCSFEMVLGRTIIYRKPDGKYLALKLLRKDEDVSNLAYENEMLAYLNEHQDKLGLISDYPKPVLVDGRNVVLVRTIPHIFDEAKYAELSDKLPPEIMDIIMSSAVQKTNGVELDVGDCFFRAMLYETKSLDYFRYISDGTLSEEEFYMACARSIHDLFTLARYGIIHTVLIRLFHNVIQRGRVDRGRYLWMIDVFGGFATRMGAGRLHSWTEAVQYPNLRLSGLSDTAELATIDELMKPENERSVRLSSFLNDDFGKNTVNFYMASYLGDYLLSMSLIVAKRFRTRGLLHWDDPESVKKLAMTIKRIFNDAYCTFTGEGTADMAAAAIDWERLARQMCFFMATGDEYADSLLKHSIPKEIYGDGVVMSFSRDYPNSRGWLDKDGKKGWYFDGANPDLGPVNGANPLTELIKALYVYSGFMVADNIASENTYEGPASPAEGPLGLGTGMIPVLRQWLGDAKAKKYQTVIEQTIFWGVNLALMPLLGSAWAVIITWFGLFVAAHFIPSDMPRPPTLLILATVLLNAAPVGFLMHYIGFNVIASIPVASIAYVTAFLATTFLHHRLNLRYLHISRTRELTSNLGYIIKGDMLKNASGRKGYKILALLEREYIKKAIMKIVEETHRRGIKTVISVGGSGEIAGLAFKRFWERLYPGEEVDLFSITEGVSNKNWQSDKVQGQIKMFNLHSGTPQPVLLLDDIIAAGATFNLIKQELSKVGITDTVTAVLGYTDTPADADICGGDLQGSISDVLLSWTAYRSWRIKSGKESESRWREAVGYFDSDFKRLASEVKAPGETTPAPYTGGLREPTEEEQINKLWAAVENRLFDSGSKKAFDEIILLGEELVSGRFLTAPETDYKICAAHLYGRGDYAYVINFIERFVDMRRGMQRIHMHIDPDGGILLTKIDDYTGKGGMLENPDFQQLYLIARMMDDDSVKNTINGEDGFFKYYLNHLAVRHSSAVIPASERQLGLAALDNLLKLASSYGQGEKRHEAVAILENLIAVMVTELEVHHSVSNSKGIERRLKRAHKLLKITRDSINEGTTIPPVEPPTAGPAADKSDVSSNDAFSESVNSLAYMRILKDHCSKYVESRMELDGDRMVEAVTDACKQLKAIKGFEIKQLSTLPEPTVRSAIQRYPIFNEFVLKVRRAFEVLDLLSRPRVEAQEKSRNAMTMLSIFNALFMMDIPILFINPVFLHIPFVYPISIAIGCLGTIVNGLGLFKFYSRTRDEWPSKSFDEKIELAINELLKNANQQNDAELAESIILIDKVTPIIGKWKLFFPAHASWEGGSIEIEDAISKNRDILRAAITHESRHLWQSFNQQKLIARFSAKRYPDFLLKIKIEIDAEKALLRISRGFDAFMVTSVTSFLTVFDTIVTFIWDCWWRIKKIVKKPKSAPEADTGNGNSPTASPAADPQEKLQEEIKLVKTWDEAMTLLKNAQVVNSQTYWGKLELAGKRFRAVRQSGFEAAIRDGEIISYRKSVKQWGDPEEAMFWASHGDGPVGIIGASPFIIFEISQDTANRCGINYAGVTNLPMPVSEVKRAWIGALDNVDMYNRGEARLIEICIPGMKKGAGDRSQGATPSPPAAGPPPSQSTGDNIGASAYSAADAVASKRGEAPGLETPNTMFLETEAPPETRFSIKRMIKHPIFMTVASIFAIDIITKLIFSFTLGEPTVVAQPPIATSANVLKLPLLFTGFFTSLFTGNISLSLNYHHLGLVWRGIFILAALILVRPFYYMGKTSIALRNKAENITTSVAYGGALANTLEIIFTGKATNWLMFPVGDGHKVVMNFADLAICTGIVFGLVSLSKFIIFKVARYINNRNVFDPSLSYWHRFLRFIMDLLRDERGSLFPGSDESTGNPTASESKNGVSLNNASLENTEKTNNTELVRDKTVPGTPREIAAVYLSTFDQRDILPIGNTETGTKLAFTDRSIVARVYHDEKPELSEAYLARLIDNDRLVLRVFDTPNKRVDIAERLIPDPFSIITAPRVAMLIASTEGASYDEDGDIIIPWRERIRRWFHPPEKTELELKIEQVKSKVEIAIESNPLIPFIEFFPGKYDNVGLALRRDNDGILRFYAVVIDMSELVHWAETPRNLQELKDAVRLARPIGIDYDDVKEIMGNGWEEQSGWILLSENAYFDAQRRITGIDSRGTLGSSEFAAGPLGLGAAHIDEQLSPSSDDGGDAGRVSPSGMAPKGSGSPLGLFNLLLSENRFFTESEIVSRLSKSGKAYSTIRPDISALVTHLGLARCDTRGEEPAYILTIEARQHANQLIPILEKMQEEYGYRPKVKELLSIVPALQEILKIEPQQSAMSVDKKPVGGVNLTGPMRFPRLYERLFSFKNNYKGEQMKVMVLGPGAEESETDKGTYYSPQMIEIIATLFGREAEFTIIDSDPNILKIASSPEFYEFGYWEYEVGPDFEKSLICKAMTKALANIMIDSTEDQFKLADEYALDVKELERILERKYTAAELREIRRRIYFKIDKDKIKNISIHSIWALFEDLDYGENEVDLFVGTVSLSYAFSVLSVEKNRKLLVRMIKALKPAGKILTDRGIFELLDEALAKKYEADFISDKEIKHAIPRLEQIISNVAGCEVKICLYGNMIEITKYSAVNSAPVPTSQPPAASPAADKIAQDEKKTPRKTDPELPKGSCADCLNSIIGNEELFEKALTVGFHVKEDLAPVRLKGRNSKKTFSMTTINRNEVGTLIDLGILIPLPDGRVKFAPMMISPNTTGPPDKEYTRDLVRRINDITYTIGKQGKAINKPMHRGGIPELVRSKLAGIIIKVARQKPDAIQPATPSPGSESLLADKAPKPKTPKKAPGLKEMIEEAIELASHIPLNSAPYMAPLEEVLRLCGVSPIDYKRMMGLVNQAQLNMPTRRQVGFINLHTGVLSAIGRFDKSLDALKKFIAKEGSLSTNAAPPDEATMKAGRVFEYTARITKNSPDIKKFNRDLESAKSRLLNILEKKGVDILQPENAGGLENCLNEMLTNAIRSLSTRWKGSDYIGAKLTLSAIMRGDYLWIEVCDNGEGFKEEILSKIGKEAVSSTGLSSRGLGLLNIANSARDIGWELVARNRTDIGYGASVSIKIPVTELVSEEISPGEEPADERRDPSKPATNANTPKGSPTGKGKWTGGSGPGTQQSGQSSDDDLGADPDKAFPGSPAPAVETIPGLPLKKAVVDIKELKGFVEAMRFLKLLGVNNGFRVIDVGPCGDPYFGLVSAALGANYIAYELGQNEQKFLQYGFELYDVNANGGGAELVSGEFSSGKNSKSENLPDHSQDVVLMLTGVLSDPSPESDKYEVLREALRVVKNHGKIAVATIGCDDLERSFAKLTIKFVLQEKQFKDKVRLEYCGNAGKLYENMIEPVAIYEVIFTEPSPKETDLNSTYNGPATPADGPAATASGDGDYAGRVSPSRMAPDATAASREASSGEAVPAAVLNAPGDVVSVVYAMIRTLWNLAASDEESAQRHGYIDDQRIKEILKRLRIDTKKPDFKMRLLDKIPERKKDKIVSAILETLYSLDASIAQEVDAKGGLKTVLKECRIASLLFDLEDFSERKRRDDDVEDLIEIGEPAVPRVRAALYKWLNKPANSCKKWEVCDVAGRLIYILQEIGAKDEESIALLVEASSSNKEIIIDAAIKALTELAPSRLPLAPSSPDAAKEILSQMRLHKDKKASEGYLFIGIPSGRENKLGGFSFIRERQYAYNPNRQIGRDPTYLGFASEAYQGGKFWEEDSVIVAFKSGLFNAMMDRGNAAIQSVEAVEFHYPFILEAIPLKDIAYILINKQTAKKHKDIFENQNTAGIPKEFRDKIVVIEPNAADLASTENPIEIAMLRFLEERGIKDAAYIYKDGIGPTAPVPAADYNSGMSQSDTPQNSVGKSWGLSTAELKQILPSLPNDILIACTRAEKLATINLENDHFSSASMRVNFERLKSCSSDAEIADAAAALYDLLKDHVRQCILWSTHNLPGRHGYRKNWKLAFVIVEHKGPLSNPNGKNALDDFYRINIGNRDGDINQNLIAQVSTQYTESDFWKKKYDLDQVTKQVMQTIIQAALRKKATPEETDSAAWNAVDIKHTIKILETPPIKPKKQGDSLKYYTVRYNNNRTKIPQGSPAEELLRSYVEKVMPAYMPGKNRVELKPSGAESQSLISVECYSDIGRSQKVGESHVDVAEDISGKAIRLIGMMNMALIASHIPNNIPDDQMGQYEALEDFIKMQYKEITGEALQGDVLKDISKGKWIMLPRALPMPVENVSEYYRLTTTQLEESA